jgi:lysophospholipase L1-like esterase
VKSIKRFVSILPAFALSMLLSGCANQLHTPTLTGSPSANAGNFSKVVFAGDSLSAGFQSGSLLDSQQPNGWNVLFAKQVGASVSQPLIAYPGAPAVLQLTALTPLPVVTSVAGTSSGRDNPTIQPTDIAVPGAFLSDLLYTQPLLVPQTGQQTMNYLVLGFPGIDQGVQYSQIQWAAQLNPTTLFVWIGNNDALIADETGNPANMTPVATFTTEYQYMMSLLAANTRANLVLINIPDVTTVPYLTPAATVLAEAATQSGLSTTALSTLLGIQAKSGTYAGDLVNPTGLAEVSAILAQQRSGPVGTEGFLSASEVTTVQATVTQYNSAIAAIAKTYTATVVDFHTTLASLITAPPTINGVTLSTGFLGGMFSLDGIHPTNTGYAIVANAVITQLNTATTATNPGLGLSIPVISSTALSAIAAADPLFPPNLKVGALTGAHHIPAAAGEHIAWLLNPAKKASGIERIR